MTAPDIDALAQERLTADEQHLEQQSTGGRISRVTLGGAWRSFWRHPSPWMISTFLAATVVGRVVVGAGTWWELLIPAGLVALFPVIEWSIHVGILHWKPRRVGPVPVDSLLARKHREHHADPRDIPLVFIPWQVLAWLLPGYALLAWLLLPATVALSLLVSIYALKLGYEWTHYLIHSDYKPRTTAYRKVWRNHRLHHYKNEHYWFTVTTAGTADRLLGTYPDPAVVRTSKTVKRLHDAEAQSAR
ncbi:MAG: sterol desaturase family protein [Nocardioides sp.]